MLSGIALDEFKKIWREEYGMELTDEEATSLAINFLMAFKHVYRPIKKGWLDDLDERPPVKPAS